MQFSAADWNSDTCALIHLDGSDSALRGNLLCISLTTPLSTPHFSDFPSYSFRPHFPLALTLSCCLYLSLYHFLLSSLPARSSSDWSLTYWGEGDGTEPMLIVCFYPRASEGVWAIDMRTSIKWGAVKKCRAGLCLAVTTVHFIQIRG